MNTCERFCCCLASLAFVAASAGAAWASDVRLLCDHRGSMQIANMTGAPLLSAWFALASLAFAIAAVYFLVIAILGKLPG